jgi:hypothetical protein
VFRDCIAPVARALNRRDPRKRNGSDISLTSLCDRLANADGARYIDSSAVHEPLSALSRLIVRLVVTLLAMAVVVVPTVMRSRQHVDLRDTTRLSIRLNWQSDAPPQKDLAVKDPRAGAVVARLSLDDPSAVQRVVRHVPETNPIPLTPFDNSPDCFRGPPALFL